MVKGHYEEKETLKPSSKNKNNLNKIDNNNHNDNQPKIIALETKTTKLPVSRFQRVRPVSDDNQQLNSDFNSDVLLNNESDFCQRLLSDGYVQSFVDFYHLTRRADPHSLGM